MCAGSASSLSEILADNESVVADEDGEISDWIELQNQTDGVVELILSKNKKYECLSTKIMS
jgi:hypothetical protein